MKKKILFFDTETTGNTTVDFLCQLAIKEQGVDEPILNALYKPPKEIPIECTMIHGISNRNVADRPSFKDSLEYPSIKEMFESPETICVAHNAAFDEQILKNDGISPTNLICTFKVIRALDTDGRFPMHKLQYLRYALDMDLEVPAHDAYGDILVLEQLFNYEIKEAVKSWSLDEDKIIEKMLAISSKPLLIREFDFGKHKGKTIAEVAQTDPGYLSWLLNQKLQSDKDEKDWIETLERHLGSKNS